MRVIETVAALRGELDRARAEGRTVGFVPTMGALHEGHASLIRRARDECDVVVVSIFVNPLQFGPAEDFERYPRTWDADVALCEELKADVLFHPAVDEAYPSREPTVRVTAGRLGEPLCGRARPGHFDGVATVVTKLFNAVGPCRAYFGRKDAQQLVVIRALARDLDMPVEVIGCPAIREADGLAMSSRNRYLTPDERSAATVLRRALEEGLGVLRRGERRASAVAAAMAAAIGAEPRVRLDYAECIDAEDLRGIEFVERPVLLAVAAWAGQARLIDNTTATPDGAAIEEG